MESIEEIRKRLIIRLGSIDNSEFLVQLDKILSRMEDSTFPLTEDQISMLNMSLKDIHEGHVIDHEIVMERERDWIRKK